MSNEKLKNGPETARGDALNLRDEEHPRHAAKYTGLDVDTCEASEQRDCPNGREEQAKSVKRTRLLRSAGRRDDADPEKNGSTPQCLE